MTWFKIDDGFTDHPKVVALMEHKRGPKSIALWTLSGAWCSRHLTNGEIGLAPIKRLGFTKSDAELLVEFGLWEHAGTGYRFHKWEKHNPSKQQVIERREKSRNKVAAWREAKSSNPVTGSVSNQVTTKSCNQTSNPAPGPARPGPFKDPPLVPPAGGQPPKPKRPRKRPATELPSDWKPSNDHRRIASSLGVDLDAEVSKFRDYCQANDRRYVDHDAALRQWLRKASEFRRSGNGRPPSGPGPVCPPEAHAAEPLPDFMRGAL